MLVCQNGDTITGEVKELEYGLLRLKTDHVGTIYVDWATVATLTSTKTFRIDLSNDEARFGSLGTPRRPGVLHLVGERDEELPLSDVVAIRPFENTFRDGLKGNFSAGINYTKSSDVLQYNLQVGVEHTDRQDQWSLLLDAIQTASGGDNTSSRDDLSLGYRRFLKNRWFLDGSLAFTSNDDLGIDLRTSLTVGGGRDIVRTNKMLLSLAAGLSGNKEDASGPTEAEWNLEAAGMLEHRLFWYQHPEMYMLNDFKVYPSLSQSGRVRADLNVRMRWEFIKDFYWELRYYLSYDSDPPSAAASQRDYGIVSSLGLTW